VGTDRDRDARVDPSQLLDRDGVLQRGPSSAAVALRKRDSHPSELPHLRDELVWKALALIELGRERRHLADCELAHGALEKLRVVVQVELHVSLNNTE